MGKKEKQPDPKITADMKIDSVLRQHPQVLPILIKHGINCAGCYISRFHDLAVVSEEHNVQLDVLLAELNAVIEESS